MEKIFEYKDFNEETQYYQEIIYNPKIGRKEARYYHLKDGEKEYGLGDMPQIPYGLHTIKGGIDLFVFESPQDAESFLSVVSEAAILATGGATTWHQTWDHQIFPQIKKRGFEKVILIPQNDPAGQSWLGMAYQHFKDAKFDVRISWICRKEKENDISDIIFKAEEIDQEILFRKISKHLMEDLPLMWRLNLYGRYAFATNPPAVRKVEKDKATLQFSFLLYPQKILVDVFSEKEIAVETIQEQVDESLKTHILTSLKRSDIIDNMFVSERTAQLVADFLDFLINTNKTIIPKEIVATKTGWKDDLYICPITAPYRPTFEVDKKIELSPITEDEAIENIRAVISRFSRSNAILPLLFSLCIPYLKTGALFEIVGETGTGKSFVCDAIAILLGYNRAHTWRTTGNAMIEMMANLDHFPMIVDEIHLAPRRDVLEIVYSLTTGQTKARLTRDIKLRELKSFTTGLVSAGEKGITDIAEAADDSYPGGLNTRTISIKFEDVLKTFACEPEELDIIRSQLRDYFEPCRGWLTKLWFDRVKGHIDIKRMGDSHVRGVLDAMYEISAQLKKIGLMDERAYQNTQDQIDLLIEETNIRFGKLTERLSGERLLKECIVENLDKFVWKNTSYIPDKKLIWGWLEEKPGDQALESPIVYMQMRNFNMLCRKEMHLSPDLIIEKGKREGWLKEDTVWVSYLKNTRYAIRIDLQQIGF